MLKAKVWLCATTLVAVVACGMLAFSGSNTASAEPVLQKDSWRHHDGHWSYWHEGDQRWYYTDGSNWFYNNATENANTWNVYGFDKGFGREGFERGEYKVPEKGIKIESPRHGSYRPNMK